MSEHLRKQIFSNMNMKDTHELVRIWRKNDRYEWSDPAFDVIKEILQTRLGVLPSQGVPRYDPHEPEVSQELIDEDEQTSTRSESDQAGSAESCSARLFIAGLSSLGFLLFCQGALLFLGFFGQSARELLTNRNSSGWPTTSGHIVSSSIDEWQESGDTYFGPRVEYEYVVSGRNYRSRRIRFGGFVPTLPDASRGEAVEIAHRYPSGETVQVYFDPTNPSLSVLEPGVGTSRILAAMAMWIVMLIFCCLVAYGCARSAYSRLFGKEST